MHVFSNVIKYLLHEKETININFEVFKYYRADEFPELEFLKRFGSVKRPMEMKTLLALDLAFKTNVDYVSLKRYPNITVAELKRTRKFIVI
jgi:hypothetical protein